MNQIHYLKNKLTDAIIIKILLLITIIVGGSVFIYSSTINFPDATGYWLMSQGILEGKFSSWFFLDKYYPETLRTPGYPLFLALVRLVFDSAEFVKGVQFLLYGSSIFISTKIVAKLSNNNQKATILFLCLSIINIQIPYYSGYIASEMATIFFVLLYFYFFIRIKNRFSFAILLGLTAGIVFQLRPSFLLFPFFIFFAYLIIDKSLAKYIAVHLVVFSLTLIPFSIWNLNNHGTFKPTSIEGGVGVAHTGYWSFLLPFNYTETFYWGNNTGHNATSPFSLDSLEREQNKVIFEQEWLDINAKLSAYQTSEDSVYLVKMKAENPGIFLLHNSNYTIEREKLLWHSLIHHIKEAPFFYFKTRVYSFFRLYFTGINSTELQNATTLPQLIKVVLPFAISFVFILCGFCFSTVFLSLQRKRWFQIQLYGSCH